MSVSRTILPPPPPERPLGKSAAPPEEVIDQQIRRTRRQVKWVEIFQGLLTLAVVGLAVLFGAALLDHWAIQGGLPSWARWTIWVGLAGWSLGYFWVKVLPLILYRIHPLYAAQTIESVRPSLRNNLINYLLLRNDPRWAPEPVVRAVEHSAARELVHLPPEGVVDRQPVIRLGYALVAVAAVLALYIILSPKSPFVSFSRVLWPWADIPAPTRVRIEAVEPGDTVAERGEPVQVSAQVRGLAEAEEVLFYYSTADGQIRDQAIPMRQEQPDLPIYSLPLDSFIARQDTQYYIRAGDARSRTYYIQVDIPLVITADRLVYEYPPYTGLGRAEVRGQGDIRAVEGTKVTIYATANQPLSQAEIDLDGQGRWLVPMRVEGSQAIGEIRLRVDRKDPLRPEYTSYLLRAQTRDGRTNRRPTRYMIEVLPDRPPHVDLRLGVLEETPEEIQLPRSRSVQIHVQAEDADFGLRRVSLQLQKQGHMLDVPPLLDWKSPRSSSAPEGNGSPGSTSSTLKGKPEGHQGPFRASWQLMPARLGLKPGDVIFYWAKAEDSKLPKPNVAQTPRRRIVIVEDPPGQPLPEQAPPQAGAGPQAPAPGQQPDVPPKQTAPDQQQENQPQEKPGPMQPQEKPQQGPADKEKPEPQPGSEGKQPSEKPHETPSDQQPAGSQPQQPEQKQPPQQEGSEQEKSPSAQQQPGQKEESGQENLPSGQPQAGQEKPPSGESTPQSKPASPAGNAQAKQPPSGGQEEPSGKQPPSAPQESPLGQQRPMGSQQSGSAQQPPSEATPPEAGQTGAGEPTGKEQPKSASDFGGAKPGPERVDPVANPGKAFEEILRDRSQQEPAGTQPSAKPDAQPEGKSAPQPESQPKGQPEGPPEGKTGIEPERKTGLQPETKTATQPEGSESPSAAGKEEPRPSEAKPTPGQPKSAQPKEPGTEKPGLEKGPPEAQEANQPRPSPSGQKPASQQPSQEPQSPSISKKQSDSRGDQSGDRSGGGQQGGGQQAPQPGVGSPGSQSPADQGGGVSQQPGPGQPTRPGHPQEAPQPTGSSGQEQGPGQSTQQSGSGAKAAPGPSGKPPSGAPLPPEGKTESRGEKPSDQMGRPAPEQLPEGTAPTEGRSDQPSTAREGTSAAKPSAHGAGNPETGGQPGQQTGPVMPNPPLRGDEANLEYTRQAVDMALEHLRDRLREGDLRILEKLRWSREDAESFLRRWEELKRQATEAPPGSPVRKQWEEMLKNLGLRPRGVSQIGQQTKPDNLRRMREGRRVPPPPDWAEQFRAFRRGIRGQEE